MIRTTALTAAALLGTALLAPTTAHAAGETCQGQPATIVGSDRDTPVVGTEGPDVIVVTGARVVDARGGDDLVCVVDTFVRQLDAGPGDDVVDVSAGDGAKAVLGAGSDTFVGSEGTDEVWTGTRARSGSPAEDTEDDVVDTGPGQDADSVHSGERGVPNGDQVRVGVLAEVSWAGTPTATSVLSSLRYSDLALDLDPRDRVSIDNAAHVITWDGASLAMPGFSSFTVSSPSSPRAFTFRGNDDGGLEYLTLDLPRPRAHRVDMGDGRNELTVSVGRPLAKGTSYRAGSGRDHIRVELTRGDVSLDLGAGRLTTRLGRTATSVRASGFAVAAATAQRATLVGSPQKDTLYVAACRGRVEGRAGADSLGALQHDRRLRCDGRRFTALGGQGNDDLWGSTGPDVLLGGPGRDQASGRGGRDVCEAEVRSSCEVRR